MSTQVFHWRGPEGEDVTVCSGDKTHISSCPLFLFSFFTVGQKYGQQNNINLTKRFFFFFINRPKRRVVANNSLGSC